MRTTVLNRQIVKIFTFFVLIIPRAALSDANVVSVLSVKNNSIGNVVDESDPEDDADCFSMGALDIVFRTGNQGTPNVGVVLTDPRGRRFGFDPLTNRAWQALPIVQGYIDCNDLKGRGTCRGVVQVCGPVSGTYKLEVIARQTTAYSVNISARSKEVLRTDGLQSTHSGAGLINMVIRARSRNMITLNYSRNPEKNVTVQLQHTSQSQSLDSRSHRHTDVKPTQPSVVGQ